MDPDQIERSNFNRLRLANDWHAEAASLHVAIPDLADSHFLRITEAVCHRAEQYGLGIHLSVTRGEKAREAEAAAVCEITDGLGLLLVGRGPVPEHVARQCDIVGVGEIDPNPLVRTIDSGHDLAIQAVVNHLAGLGHTAIRFIHTGLSYASAESRETFLGSGHRRGLGDRLSFVDIGDDPQHAATIAAIEEDQATAIVVCNDLVATQLVEQLQGHGFRVPADVSIAGCCACPDAAASSSLTTVDRRADAIADTAVQALLHQRVPDTAFFAPRLATGATTAMPARRRPLTACG